MISPKTLAPCDHDECGLLKCRQAKEQAPGLLDAASCSALAGCGCDVDDLHDVEMYYCADCGYPVAVCLGCQQIRRGCECGTCETGDPFEEDTE